MLKKKATSPSVAPKGALSHDEGKFISKFEYVCIMKDITNRNFLEKRIKQVEQKAEDALLCYPIHIRAGDQVTVRSRMDGDKLYFHNMNIHKKLSDFLIDKKIPLHERDAIPLICVNDSVRVVVGHFYEDVTDCPQEELYYIILK